MNNFRFNMELAKAEEIDGKYFISGVCATTDVDKQNEMMSKHTMQQMVQTAVGIPLVKSHQHELLDELGTITKAELLNDGNSLKITAELDSTDPEAMRCYNKLAKGGSAGFSVGGNINRIKPGQGKAKRIIDDVSLVHVAITNKPVNPNTFALALKKSLNEELMKDIKTIPLNEDNITLIKSLNEKGSAEVQGLIRSLLGDEATPILGEVVLTKSEPLNLDLLKSEILAEVKLELAKAITANANPQPQGLTNEPSKSSIDISTNDKYNAYLASQLS